tara:strand:- start:1379 stop:1639 length:261 start_codon:yes stop_codon:yes gene_type:complete
MLLETDELDVIELCRDAKGRRNLNAERVWEDRERIRKRLGWAIKKGDCRKVKRLEERLAKLETEAAEPSLNYAKEAARQRYIKRPG